MNELASFARCLKVPGMFKDFCGKCAGHVSKHVSGHVSGQVSKLFRASRRFSLLQTLCARRYEKRTQQAELVGKMRCEGVSVLQSSKSRPEEGTVMTRDTLESGASTWSFERSNI